MTCTITTNTWKHKILLNEVPSPRGRISQYKYIYNTYKGQYKISNNNNNIKKNNIVCIQLNDACCRLYQAFEIKSATYFTNISFIKKLINRFLTWLKYLLQKVRLNYFSEKVYLSTYYKNHRYIKNEFRFLLRLNHKKYNIFHY